MTYFIVCRGEVIGSTTLDGRDPSMGAANGAFTPTAADERVRSTFRRFTDAEARKDEPGLLAYYAERDRLWLTLRSEAGVEIETDAIHIVDYSEEIDDQAYEVQVILAETGVEKLDPPA
jgi:hypothetical protein